MKIKLIFDGYALFKAFLASLFWCSSLAFLILFSTGLWEGLKTGFEPRDIGTFLFTCILLFVCINLSLIGFVLSFVVFVRNLFEAFFDITVD